MTCTHDLSAILPAGEHLMVGGVAYRVCATGVSTQHVTHVPLCSASNTSEIAFWNGILPIVQQPVYKPDTSLGRVNALLHSRTILTQGACNIHEIIVMRVIHGCDSWV